MLDFVLRNVPDNWDEVVSYDSSYILFELHPYDKEYTKIRNLFESFEVTSIKRVQNPFQYGRFKLRHEMIRDSYVEEVRTKCFFAVILSTIKIIIFTVDTSLNIKLFYFYTYLKV